MQFEALRETLLRGGVAPRHVRRTLAELEDHLADLTARERDAGHSPQDAALRARAALGDDTMLAEAVLARPKLRSLTARAPWLVFCVAPPLALIFGFLLLLIALILVGVASGAIIPRHKILLPLPVWFDWTVTSLMFAANFLVAALLGSLMAWTAQRQRLKLLWPLLGMALILLLNLHGEFHAETRRLGISLGTMLPFYPAKGPFGPAGAIHWATLLGQAALLCLPMTWLVITPPA